MTIILTTTRLELNNKKQENKPKSTKQEYVVIWGFTDIQKVGSTNFIGKKCIKQSKSTPRTIKSVKR
jgi:hypothetical protein